MQPIIINNGLDSLQSLVLQIIDLATLTGAMRVALGPSIAGN
jgi:leucyl aminopeptidase